MTLVNQARPSRPHAFLRFGVERRLLPAEVGGVDVYQSIERDCDRQRERRGTWHMVPYGVEQFRAIGERTVSGLHKSTPLFSLSKIAETRHTSDKKC